MYLDLTAAVNVHWCLSTLQLCSSMIRFVQWNIFSYPSIEGPSFLAQYFG